MCEAEYDQRANGAHSTGTSSVPSKESRRTGTVVGHSGRVILYAAKIDLPSQL